VLHPFGRYCNGFKSAGEVDVLEALASVESRYAIDADRVVLMGFSMGGAGAWHLGARHARLWAAVSPGAGFAETAQYNRLEPSTYPPWYEQRLWALHDVPRVRAQSLQHCRRGLQRGNRQADPGSACGWRQPTARTEESSRT
jgi:dienelactone hydrolase